MTRLLAIAICALLVFAACKSSDKKEPKQDKPTASAPAKTETEKNTGVAAPAEKNSELCNTPPNIKMCCQALTPTCNQCRADNEQVQSAWREACGNTKLAKLDCSGGPPVFECCDENNAACQDCRESAARALAQWKSQCADYVAHSCDQKPPQEACCEALTPACEACNQRNLRVMNEWSARCEK